MERRLETHVRGNHVRVARIPVRPLAGALALAVAVFAAATAAVLASNQADELDVRFVVWVHDAAPGALVDVMRVLTYLGSVVVLGPLALAAGIVLARRGHWRSAAFVFSAFLAGQLVSQGLKALVERSRPRAGRAVRAPLHVRVPERARVRRHHDVGRARARRLVAHLGGGRRVLLAAGAALAVGVVAASRVILGAHYALDVLAGIAGGIAVLAALLLLLGPRRLRRDEQPQRAGLDRQLERRLEQNRLAVDRGPGHGSP